MIANTFFAAGAFVSLVAAIPLAQPPFPKRDVVWETHTEVAMTTIPVTVTHWLEPGETPPTVGKGHYGHNGHGHGGHGSAPSQPETTQPAAPPASSPESTAQAPAPSSYEQPSPPPAAPTTTQAPPPAAPTTQAPPPVAPTTTQAAPPAYTPEPAPSSPSTGGGAGLSGMAAPGKSYTGDLTYYDPGLGACGVTSGPSESIVAISEAIFDAYMPASGNPNQNPLCGKYVTITGENGSPYKAKIVDRCTGCAASDLDLSPDFFKTVVPTGDGRVPGVTWQFD